MTEFSKASRLDVFQTGIFAALNEEKERLQREGRKLYNLFIGTPDFKPAPHVMQALCEAAADPENWKYSLTESPELLEAVCSYYRDRFGVTITPDIITAVNGSQEGMGHLGMALCNKGDVVLLPDPGYPAFEAGALLGEATVETYPLIKEYGFMPRLDLIDEKILKKVKYMVVSYPSNPVGAAAPEEVYEELIGYAKKYGFILISDNAYSDILFDGREGFSFLSLDGAADVGAEFFSLSKSFNVTGARISFLIGNKSVIEAMKLLRSQYDFGMFTPIQKAAIAALTGPRDAVRQQCTDYQARRDALCGGLRRYGWDIPDSDGTMFVWAPLPAGFTDSAAFCKQLVRETGVLCTPGAAFGKRGEGYVRFALVLPPEELAEVADIIGQSGFLK
ncbi:MAG: aminotransferase class I/II-fold pyridoxal phosphate-dependent enzyme [Ruminococcaceae bacterium]|nr:aminotransferase class I/II-fold pyridoxal phosphate-dependent enzyme [Oscillospiraceae bacterium]